MAMVVTGSGSFEASLYADTPTADDPVTAAQLFSDAHALVDAGKWDEGCPKYEASLKLHASSSTAINLARCASHYNKIATAWTWYQKALSLIGETEGAERQQALTEIAKKEMADIEATVPHLTVTIQGAPGAGLDVRRDSVPLDAAALGARLPLDPGDHELVVRAPGRKTVRQTFALAASEDKTIALALELDTATGPEVPVPPKPKETGGGVPPWAFVTGALGLAAGGIAIGFLVDDVNASRALRENCYQEGKVTGCKSGFDYAADNRRKNVGGGVALGLGITGIALLGASVGGFIMGSMHTSAPAASPPVAVMPFFGTDGGGVVIGGRL